MASAKPMAVRADPHPFVKAFPTLAATIKFVAAVLRLFAVVGSRLWPYRRELTLLAGYAGLWWAVDQLLPGSWALAITTAITGGALVVPKVRMVLCRWLRGGRTRRWLRTGLAHTRSANMSGKLPRITGLRHTVIGERFTLRLPPGQSYELLDTRVEELRAAVRSRDVRLRRDVNRADLVTVDVVRVDPLTGSGPVAWADQDDDVLSIWDPIHFGISELGEPVRLSVAERTVLAAGNKGAGKSTFLKLLLAHSAKCPDAQQLIIDPNRVHTAWKDRAFAFADHDLDAGIGVLDQVQAEMDRRLSLLPTLPGSPESLTREVSHGHGLPMWLLFVDELAYPLSVAGTKAQQNYFYTTLRDIVARGRSAGMVVVAATQRPTADLIPTSLRDLFDIRIAFRTMTKTSSDVILGDDFAKRGFCATDIDINDRGVNWLFAEGRDPIRTKTAWISGETRTDLAVTTIRHRPPGPDLVDAVPNPRTEMPPTSPGQGRA